MSSDRDIIQESRVDPAAFRGIYDRHAVTVHRYAARRVGSAVADDILSETFLVAFQHRSRFDHAWPDARPWLLGIATTLLKRHARVEARAWYGLVTGGAAELATWAGLDAIEALGDRIDASARLRRLVLAIERLPARDRDTLLLYAWGGLDYEGVARALDVPVGTVRSRLNRVRRMLHVSETPGFSRVKEVDHGQFDSAQQGA